MTITLDVDFVTETCCYKACSLMFAMTRAFYNKVQQDSNHWWYCPEGHRQHYTGKTDATRLEEAKIREEALKDQLFAAVSDAERTRGELLRDRQRFANGVCPCCNRSFDNVRRHMTTKHPDYDATVLVKPKGFKCSCGRTFATIGGLHQHQTKQRSSDWTVRAQKTDYWSQVSAHLTRV